MRSLPNLIGVVTYSIQKNFIYIVNHKKLETYLNLGDVLLNISTAIIIKGNLRESFCERGLLKPSSFVAKILARSIGLDTLIRFFLSAASSFPFLVLLFSFFSLAPF